MEEGKIRREGEGQVVRWWSRAASTFLLESDRKEGGDVEERGNGPGGKWAGL